MNEIGVSTNPNYKIAFYMDCGAMISIYTSEYGLLNVKPLKVIWDKFPEFYTHKNTIMFDDLKRNFLMNPQNGLRIEPYKNAHSNRTKDKELYKLSIYLRKISSLDDLSNLKHKYWQKYIENEWTNKAIKQQQCTDKNFILIIKKFHFHISFDLRKLF